MRTSALHTGKSRIGYASATDMSDSQRRNASLDTLRVIAVLAVFVHHLRPSLLDVGDRGVDLFFVLSGYLIGGILFTIYRTQGTIAPLSFWRDRWLRTLPAYYATLAIYAGKELASGGALVRTLGPYVLFLQSYWFGSLTRFHHSWSLAVEEHFYLVLPLVMLGAAKLGKKNWVMPLALAIGGGLLITRTVLMASGHDLQLKLTHWRTDALIVGVLLAWLAQRPTFQPALVRRRHLIAAVTVLLLGVGGWIDLAHPGYFELPIALACGGLVMLGIAHHAWLEVPGKTRVVAWIARISYSFYLVQPLLMTEILRRNLPHRLGSAAGWPLAVALCLALTLAASQLLYTCVERPGLALRQRMRARR
jgi:peptidoglycan/LPS O-acetylase OafA/YrhL